MKRIIFISLLWLVIAAKPTEAASVKISFLDNEDAIKQTTKFLLAKGCDQESVNLFRELIDGYNSTPTDLDLKKFPPRENGFYSFQSVSNLVEAFAHPLIYTYHQNYISCFETVILLAGSRIQIKLQPDDIIYGPYFTSVYVTNNVVGVGVAATPRDAFNLSHPPWYVDVTKDSFSGPMQDKRICLMAALDTFYFLPHSTTRENFGNKLLQAVQSSWKRQGIKFPASMKAVICYGAVFDPPDKCFRAWSTHIGLLFQNGGQYVFIDKLGSSAPCVRFDFKDKNDLLMWIKAEVKPTVLDGEFLYVSFNDKEIKSLDEIDR